MEQRISLITLGVDDLTKMRNFFEKGLGWRVSPASQGDVVFIQLGGLVLSLYPRKLLADDAQIDHKSKGFRGFTLAYNVRQKSEVAGVLKVAQTAGAKILKQAEDTFWGGHGGYFADPEGNIWEVAWNPHFQMNDRGDLVLP